MSTQPWDEHYKPSPEEWAQMLRDKAPTSAHELAKEIK